MRRYYMKNSEAYRRRERAWRAANPEKYKASVFRTRLRSEYGITPEQYEAMLRRQAGVCAICRRPPRVNRLSVDHDHGPLKTVRGLACHVCNRYRIGKNTIETAKAVLAYLESGFDGRAL